MKQTTYPGILTHTSAKKVKEMRCKQKQDEKTKLEGKQKTKQENKSKARKCLSH